MIHRRRLLKATPAAAACAVVAPFIGPVSAQAVALKFGQSASLSGGQARYGSDVRDGILAAFEAANRAVVVRGAKFEHNALDDGGERERCKGNVKTLIDGGAISIVGLTSGAGAEACLQLT